MHKYLADFRVEKDEDRITVYTPHSLIRKRTILYKSDYNEKNWNKIESLVEHLKRAIEPIDESGFGQLVHEGKPVVLPKKTKIFKVKPQPTFLDRLLGILTHEKLQKPKTTSQTQGQTNVGERQED